MLRKNMYAIIHKYVTKCVKESQCLWIGNLALLISSSACCLNCIRRALAQTIADYHTKKINDKPDRQLRHFLSLHYSVHFFLLR